MKRSLIASLAILAVASCAGDFCETYQPLDLTPAGAAALVAADRLAAENAAVNETAYGRCRALGR